MMGRSHALCGLIVGVGLAAAVPYAPLPVRLLLVPVTGGAALLPDLDHPSSKIAHSLGFVTKFLAKVFDEISVAIYHATRLEGDPSHREGGHRLITHTVPGCLFFGAECCVAELIHPIAGAVHLALLLGLLTGWVRQLGRKAQYAAGGVIKAVSPKCVNEVVALVLRNAGLLFTLVGGYLSWMVMTQFSRWWWVWPIAVFLGSVAHLAGDACTNSGVPLWFPMPRGDKRWGKVRLPRTFETGKEEETHTVTPLLGISFVVALCFATGMAQLLIAAVVS
jgi:membrane-bound metal-dependent hydrolase YbcI (DUF457 family)